MRRSVGGLKLSEKNRFHLNQLFYCPKGRPIQDLIRTSPMSWQMT